MSESGSGSKARKHSKAKSKKRDKVHKKANKKETAEKENNGHESNGKDAKRSHKAKSGKRDKRKNKHKSSRRKSNKDEKQKVVDEADEQQTGSSAKHVAPIKEKLNVECTESDQAQALCASLAVTRSARRLHDLRVRLETAIADEDFAELRGLVRFAEQDRAALPSEVMDRARMSVALFDAMRCNQAHEVSSLLEEADGLLLSKGAAMPVRQTCVHFLSIDDALRAPDRDLESLQSAYAATVAECPDVPNRPLLYDAIYAMDTKQQFAARADEAVKSMLLRHIEDALLYGKRHALEHSMLYKKLTRLFDHEQQRKYMISKRALFAGVNFDQVFFEEEQLKVLNAAQGQRNLNNFTSPFDFQEIRGADEASDEPYVDAVSLSFDADIAELRNTAPPHTANARDSDKVHAQPAAVAVDVLDQLSDELDSEFASDSDLYDELSDIIGDLDLEMGIDADVMDGALSMDRRACDKMDAQRVSPPPTEPFVSGFSDVDGLNAMLQRSLDTEYADFTFDSGRFENLRRPPSGLCPNVSAIRGMFCCAANQKPVPFPTHKKRCISQTITNIKSAETAQRLVHLNNVNLRTILGYKKLEAGTTMEQLITEYLNV